MKKVFSIIIKLIALFAILFILMGILSIPFMLFGNIRVDGDEVTSGYMPVFITQNIAMVAASLLLWKWFERQSFSALGFHASHKIHRFSVGSILGFVLISLVFIIYLFTGQQETVFNPEEASGGQLALGILNLLFSMIIIAVGEETFSRGYIQGMIKHYYNPTTAVIVTSLLFGLAHIANSHFNLLAFANITLAGILLGVAREVSGSLYLPIGIHFTWNFAQALLGYPVSGNEIASTPLFQTTETGADWITGGAFGPEAGIASVIVLLLGIWWLKSTKSSRQ